MSILRGQMKTAILGVIIPSHGKAHKVPRKEREKGGGGDEEVGALISVNHVVADHWEINQGGFVGCDSRVKNLVIF